MKQKQVYKAQWPLDTNSDHPMILVTADNPPTCIMLAATKEMRKHVFQDRYIRVFFRGEIIGHKIHVDEFVRRGEWLEGIDKLGVAI